MKNQIRKLIKSYTNLTYTGKIAVKLYAIAWGLLVIYTIITAIMV